MIHTFYSYKGGVGRSMALANIAELLYSKGLRVLMIDFDLEAPGLEQYFYKKDDPLLKKVLAQRGIIDLLLSYRELRSLPFPQASPDDEAEVKAYEEEEEEEEEEESPPTDDLPADEAFPYPVEPLDNFTYEIHPRSSQNPGELLLITAGRRVREVSASDDQPYQFTDEFGAYADHVRAFGWDDFYLNWDGEQFFNWFYEKTLKRAEVVLIDSRTGVAEMSGVCTYQLADVVVMFVAPNNQNVDGTKKIAASLVNREDLIKKRYKQRKLSVIFVPSRVDLGEKYKVDDLAVRFREVASKLASPDLTFETDTFTDLTIPYIPYYSFVEELVTSDSDSLAANKMKGAYENICRTLAQLDPAIKAQMKEEVDDPGRVNVAERQNRLAEHAYSKLSPDQQQAARSIFTRLVRLALPEEGERKDTPKDVKLSDLTPELKAMAKVLETEKLLILGKDAAGQETVGLAEEDLIQNWKRFKGWIDEDREFLSWRQKLQTSISDWEKAGRDKAFLLQSSRYAEAEKLLHFHQGELNLIESEYIYKSLAKRRRERLQRFAEVAAVILAIFGLGFAIYTYRQTSSTREETLSRLLASNAETRIASETELSVLLAVEAMRLAPTSEAQQALKDALRQSRLYTVIRVGANLYSAQYSHDGKSIVTGSGGNTSLAQIWQQGGSNNWQNLIILRGHTGQVTTAAFSPDDKFIATASHDGKAIIWDATTGQMSQMIGPAMPQPFTQSLADIDWSPDGTLVAVANMSDNHAYVWDVRTLKLIRSLNRFTSDVMSVSFSPDGKYLAAGSKDSQVRVWDVKSWEEARAPLEGHMHGVLSVRFSRDGAFLVTADEDNAARVWQTSDWRTIAVLSGHSGPIRRASFSPDNRYIVTASKDGTAIIWETATGNRVAVLRGLFGFVNDASFSPDGKLILTASSDGTARLWELNVEIKPDISSAELVSLACTKVARNMTEEEWRQFMGTEAYRLTCPDIQPLQPVQTPTPAASSTPQPQAALTGSSK